MPSKKYSMDYNGDPSDIASDITQINAFLADKTVNAYVAQDEYILVEYSLTVPNKPIQFLVFDLENSSDAEFDALTLGLTVVALRNLGGGFILVVYTI